LSFLRFRPYCHLLWCNLLQKILLRADEFLHAYVVRHNLSLIIVAAFKKKSLLGVGLFFSFFFRPWGCFHNHLLGEACNSRSGIQQEWSKVLSLLGDGFDSNEWNSYGNKSV
jgi:hypothetical protein